MRDKITKNKLLCFAALNLKFPKNYVKFQVDRTWCEEKVESKYVVTKYIRHDFFFILKKNKQGVGKLLTNKGSD